MSRREQDEFIPWYTGDSVSWLRLSFAARGVAEGIARKMGSKGDRLRIRRGDLDGLAMLLRGTIAELGPAMQELLAPGPTGEPPRLVWEDEYLIDPEALVRRRRTSADRMRDKRARDASDDPPVTQISSDGCDAPSPLLSSSLICSREGEREREVPPESTVVPVAPASSPERDPPPWFVDVAERVRGDTGEKFQTAEAWIRYAGHRGKKRVAMNANDASYWLGTVMVPEARHDRERQRARRPDDRPEVRPPTKAESQAFTDALMRRLRADPRVQLGGGGS